MNSEAANEDLNYNEIQRLLILPNICADKLFFFL